MLPTSLDDLQSSGVSLFFQENRLLTLRFGAKSSLGRAALVPHRLMGEEHLSKNYQYQLDCLSADAYLELKELVGQPVEIALLLPDGGERLLTGLVTRAEHKGSDGGFAAYRLTIEPALATLAHRRNSRVFQDKTVPAIVATLLDEHIASNPAIARSFQHQAKLTKTYPVRSYTLQYRESDLAFIERLLAEEGISYTYRHGADPSRRDRRAGSDEDPLHTLVLFDANAELADAEHGAVRFHRTDGAAGEDAIDQWESSRQLQSNKTTLASYDYRSATSYDGSDTSRARHGESGAQLNGSLEDYDPQSAYYGSDPEEMTRYAALRQQAKDFAGKVFFGQGTARGLAPGSWFQLADHPIHDQARPEDREFLITGMSFEAENNLTADALRQLGPLLGAKTGSDGQQPPYRNSFQAVRRSVAVVPPFSQSRHQKPSAHGLTTATVVGPAGEEIFTDEEGRIKIQFHWQRPLDHPEGGAGLDERSSTWVRVAMPSAGAGWGSQYIPRVGQEVVIDFIEGDIDRPLVTGVVYNGRQRPPAFSGVGSLPANKTLSGIKTKEHQGGSYNELLFDDSTGQLRTKLSSEHGKTQLNQGYLIHPRSDGKGEPRGEGFELRTDQYGALRGARGILISAEGRERAVGNQLDRDMLLGQLQAAEGTAKCLSDLSTKHGAEATETDQQSQLLRHVKNWETGCNTAGKDNTAEGGKSIIALSAPMGIVAGTPQSATITTGHSLDLISAKHTSVSVGGKLMARVTEAVSYFVQGIKEKVAIKLIAALGDFEVKALDGELRLYARRKISIVSDEEIEFQAPKITSIAQGVRTDLGGGDITTQCRGTHTQKAAQHELTGSGGGATAGKFNPTAAQFDQKTALTWMGTGDPIANRRYRLKLEDGRILEGVTDTEGHTEQFQSEIGFARYRIELLPDQS